MTIDELIKILENYEVFVDDDYGGSYKSVIAYAPDKKVSRAHTPIGTLKIIDTFEELQQENQELKQKINTYENPNDLTLMFMYCNEKARDMIEELKKQLEVGKEQYNDLVEEKEELQEQLSNSHQIKDQQKEFIEWLEQNIENEEYCYLAQNPGERCRKDVFEEALSKYKEIIGGKHE